MKKGIVIGIVFLLVVMSFTSISGIQIDKNIIIPSYKGNILYVGGSGEGNYTTIQSAIDDAVDGDTVFVFDDSSPYNETVVIDKSICLIGEDRDTTVIDGNNTFWFTVKILKSLVNISGFTIYNGSLLVETPDGVIISNNHFINNDNGGIVFWGGDNSLVISNTFTNCDISILLDESSNVRISDNSFIWNTMGSGQYIDSEIWIRLSSDIVISNNTFINLGWFEKYHGLLFTDGGSSIIEGNLFEGYFTAIGFRYSVGNLTISHNTFIDNDEALSISQPNSRNSITNNNFINNRNDASAFILSKDKWDGNYWDEWIGLKYPILSFLPYFSYSLLGSIPYGFVFDWHPAKEPYNYTSTKGCGIE